MSKEVPSSAEVGPLLELSGITKRFGPVDVLRGIDLKINRAEAIGLIGDNGAGKSTLVKILSGVYKQTSGDINFAGQPISLNSPLDARRLGIEMIYQDLALCNDLNVASNIFLGQEMQKRVGPFSILDRKKMSVSARKVLNDMGAPIEPHLNVGTLSGGQRQLVAVARGLLFNPKLFLLDEPTAALANEKIRLLLNLIEGLKQRGVSVLLVSHRFTDLIRVCDRILVLRQGRIVEEILPKERSPEQSITLMERAMSDVQGDD